MADIRDRLERLDKREELARRAGQRPVTVPAEGVGEDFVEVLEAVARAVRRHPGLSVMVAAADGRPGRTVVRVTERDGEVETALVVPSATPAATQVVDSGRHAEPSGPLAGRPAGAQPNGSSPPYHRPITDRQPYSRRGAARQLRAVGNGRHEPVEAPDPTPAPDPIAAPDHVATPAPVQTAPAAPGWSANVGSPGAGSPGAGSADYGSAGYGSAGAAPADHGSADQGSAGSAPAGSELQRGVGTGGLVALPPDTSQVVARLAQLLRDDPTLAAGWARER